MSAQTNPTVVTDAAQNSWLFQQSYIERLMDHSALTSAHPDDTLILAGPARLLADSQRSIFDYMLPLGMLMQFQVSQSRPSTPAQTIGSGRLCYLDGKAPGTASIGRLLVNGRNLLRALYTNAVQAGIDPTRFDDIAAQTPTGQFFCNLDSELFGIPFGMAALFRDKIHNTIGAFYLELCKITGWNLSIAAGQAMIMENCSLMFDRLVPIDMGAIGDPTEAYGTNYTPSDAADSNLFQSIFGTKDTTSIDTHSNIATM